MSEREDALRLLMALSRIEGFVISKTGLTQLEGIVEDLEQASRLCLKFLDEIKKRGELDGPDS